MNAEDIDPLDYGEVGFDLDRLRVIATAVKGDPNFAQCLRCRKYHRMIHNHDSLCDRCCRVLVEIGHESTADIRAAYDRQRERYRSPA